MTTTSRHPDWLSDLRALNRLFLDYLVTLAREARPCLGLPAHVARRLRDARPETLDRIAELPVALFRLVVMTTPVQHALPRDRHEQIWWSLTLTILSSAWHLTRSHPFEARAFLHLSDDEAQHLRAIPVSELATLARSPTLLRCAFADGAFTWPALVRLDEIDDERMLTLIALQPAAAIASRPTAYDTARLSV